MIGDDVSGLRWLAIGCGLLMIFAGIWWGRRRQVGTTSPLVLAGLGIGLALVGAFPAFAQIPAAFFVLDEMDGGALILLLIVSSILLWLSVLWNRAKIDFLRSRLNGTLVNFAAQEFLRELPEKSLSGTDDELPTQSGEVYVVIPALNEADHIQHVIKEIPEAVHGRTIRTIVVDDGSTDRTGAVARAAGALVLRMPINSGQGSALKAGYLASLQLGAEAVVTLDADGQNRPREIGEVVGPVLSGDVDVMIGSRVLGKYERTNLSRTVGVYVFNTLLTVLTGTRITDCASSFRAFSADVLRTVNLQQEQYQSPEILIEAARAGFKVSECPIHWRRRQKGETKKGGTLKYGLFFMRTIVKTWAR